MPKAELESADRQRTFVSNRANELLRSPYWWPVYAEFEKFGSLKDGAAYVAKRFAAKEAFFKALGASSFTANTWHQLSVVNDAVGKPSLACGPLLSASLHEKKISSTHVTLSDERTHAVAFVILERESQ